jgi:hypothetical protein
MTPAEVAAKLRQFNERFRDCQFDDPHRVMEAIDAAIKMIEQVGRVEAAATDLVRMKGRHNTEIAYQRLVAALEKSK